MTVLTLRHPDGSPCVSRRRPTLESIGPAITAPFLDRSLALDGLRGLALTWVVTYHFTSSHGPLPGGWVGLDVFFALSGFLITAMLLDERRVHGRVDLPRFYARRACRLLPALLTMLSVWVVLLLAFHDTTWFAATPGGDGTGNPVQVGPALGQIGITLGYGVNWLYALGSGSAPLAHLWSLAVEEQFYLVWPFALLVLLRLLPARRRVVPVLALAGLSAALPLLYWNSGAGTDRIYFGTDTRAVGMLLGAVAALAWHRRRTRSRPMRLAVVRAYTAVVVILTFLLTVGNVPVKSLGGPAVLAVAAMQLVPYLVEHPESLLARALHGRVLVWLGARSYSVYLWHYLWATWLNPLSPWCSIPLGVGASLTCAWASWHWVEAPSLRFGRRFRPLPRRQGQHVTPASPRPQVSAAA